jgi:hypothetical protein
MVGRILARRRQGKARGFAQGYHRQLPSNFAADRIRWLERMREPYVKHLEGPLWEMRMKGKDGVARAA